MYYCRQSNCPPLRLQPAEETSLLRAGVLGGHSHSVGQRGDIRGVDGKVVNLRVHTDRGRQGMVRGDYGSEDRRGGAVFS